MPESLTIPPPAFESSVGRATPAELLSAIAKRLRTATGLTEHACFVTLDPQAEATRIPGDLWVTVSPVSGQFSAGLIAGGGLAMLGLSWGVLVCVHSVNRLDEVGRDPLWMAGQADQTMDLLHRALASLTGWGVDEGLRDPLAPTRLDFAREGSRHTAELAFSCLFDWWVGTGEPTTPTDQAEGSP